MVHLTNWWGTEPQKETFYHYYYYYYEYSNQRKLLVCLNRYILRIWYQILTHSLVYSHQKREKKVTKLV